MEQRRQEIRELLARELELTREALRRLLEPTQPETPLPRRRRFTLAPGIYWPASEKASWYEVCREGGRWYDLQFSTGARDLVDDIATAVGWQPRGIMRAVENIRRWRAWLEARRAGRLRAAEEILRQQQRWTERLENEIVLDRLGRL